MNAWRCEAVGNGGRLASAGAPDLVETATKPGVVQPRCPAAWPYGRQAFGRLEIATAS
jgi:hypothetical protein